PSSALLPYTTLFRSTGQDHSAGTARGRPRGLGRGDQLRLPAELGRRTGRAFGGPGGGGRGARCGPGRTAPRRGGTGAPGGGRGPPGAHGRSGRGHLPAAGRGAVPERALDDRDTAHG